MAVKTEREFDGRPYSVLGRAWVLLGTSNSGIWANKNKHDNGIILLRSNHCSNLTVENRATRWHHNRRTEGRLLQPLFASGRSQCIIYSFRWAGREYRPNGMADDKFIWNILSGGKVSPCNKPFGLGANLDQDQDPEIFINDWSICE